MKRKFAFTIAIAAGMMMAACGTNEKPEQQETTTTTEQAAVINTTHAYICPMDCENSASMSPGQCPVCGMDLVKNPNYKGEAVADTLANTGMDAGSTEHNHDDHDSHEGHNH